MYFAFFDHNSIGFMPEKEQVKIMCLESLELCLEIELEAKAVLQLRACQIHSC
ncbi:MAG: hypothetical protein MUO43_03495 [Desulfobacterales bacterium]|nr:hypothetical protein [Desulfobacterales bacterium]